MGTSITITDTGFVPGARVVIGQVYGPTIGTIAATVESVTSTTITAITGGNAKAERGACSSPRPEGQVPPTSATTSPTRHRASSSYAPPAGCRAGPMSVRCPWGLH